MKLIVGVTLALGLALAASPALAALEDPATRPAAEDSGDDDALDLMSLLGGGRAKGPERDAQIAEALKHPLGSRENPVRVNMPAGQRSYLSRLRCPDGATPDFSRDGSVGIGPYGTILDVYSVVCPGPEPRTTSVFMDMYHPDHAETAAPEGFTLYQRRPQR